MVSTCLALQSDLKGTPLQILYVIFLNNMFMMRVTFLTGMQPLVSRLK